jgi:superfamily II DNA/RNA helicase
MTRRYCRFFLVYYVRSTNRLISNIQLQLRYWRSNDWCFSNVITLFCVLTTSQDYYLYGFLHQFPGRTIVFVNAISNIRRIVPLIALLQVPVWGLHSGMQQRQRLKNLDRFKASTNGVLVATDVAARGLDIPNIEHVVHYQIPFNVDVRCSLITV